MRASIGAPYQHPLPPDTQLPPESILILSFVKMATTNGPTFFSNLKKSFADVPVDSSKDNAIPTTEFLEASESLCSLFGM